MPSIRTAHNSGHFPPATIDYSSPAIGADGTIYVGSSDGNLYAINPDGTQKWVFPTGESDLSSPALGADGTIYVGSWDTNLYAINPDGTLQWAFATNGCIRSSPAFGADGTIYLGSWDGNFYAINANGTQKWMFSTGTGHNSSPAIGADGTIYVGSDDGKLYAITQQPPPTITSFTPTNGSVQTVVTITGANFTGATAVDFGGTAAASFTVVSDTSISATVGKGATGVIAVTTLGGMATSTGVFTYTPPLAKVTLSATPPSWVISGMPVHLLATAEGGTNVLFQFWLASPFVNPPWSLLQDYSSSAGCTWTPAATGGYTVEVIAQDATGAFAAATLKYYACEYPPLTAVSVTAAPASPQLVNTPITFIASVTDGTNVQYQFWLYNQASTPAWSQLQAYSSAATCQWSPTVAGNYLLSVTAQDITGATANVMLWYTVNNAPLTAVAVTASPNSPQLVNTPITFTASATGGSSVQYQFWLYNQASTPAWSQLQAYSSTATCQWTPTVAGNYLLSVTALGDTGTANVMLWYTVNNAPLSAVSVTASPRSPQLVNTPITFTACAVGGTNVQYQFWIYNQAATPAWSQLQAYSSQSACVWTPGAAGQYLLSVTAQDATGASANSMCWYTVLDGSPLSTVYVTTSPDSPQAPNTPITFTATAFGGVNVQYQFWLYNPAATPAWSQLQAYSPQATCVWTPATAGSYLLSVTAQDATGAAVNTLLAYAINSIPALSAVSVTASPALPQLANTPITFTASATGGTNVQYQFWIYNQAATPAWSQLQTYSTQTTCAWTPMAAGNYLLSVTARDATGAAANITCWYTVLAGKPLSSIFVTTAPDSPQTPYTPITFTARAFGGVECAIPILAVQSERHTGVVPVASLFPADDLRVDADGGRELSALRHRTGRHRGGAKYLALGYRAVNIP